ncbi:MAG: 50S ribosomal protein L6 [Endomicrobium sp.]|jgi:large subunit ribosomal protein L6|nr:50S ribosomal protein L6 [Endomicrobium sp.]
MEMSRLENKPINIPNGVNLQIVNGMLYVRGPKGVVTQVINDNLQLTIDTSQNIVTVERKIQKSLNKRKTVHISIAKHRGLQGLFRGIVSNMIQGVTLGFKKELSVIGLGYKANIENNNIVLTVGFSHLVKLQIPKTLEVITKLMLDKSTLISVIGIDKCIVGTFAAKIRQVKPSEPYKGFGIRYINEKVIRKAGKVATSSNKK